MNDQGREGSGTVLSDLARRSLQAACKSVLERTKNHAKKIFVQNNERLDLIEIEAPGQPSPRTAQL